MLEFLPFEIATIVDSSAFIRNLDNTLNIVVQERSSIGRGHYPPQLPEAVDIEYYKRPICDYAKPPIHGTSVGKILPATNWPPENSEKLSQ